MGLSAPLDTLRETVASAAVVVPVGARTHWEVGGAPPSGTEVKAPAGVVAYDPADLTVTVGAGTTVADLATVLSEAGQECPLDPRSADATVGGVLAAGLSGHRRLRYGPLRDRVLEVRFVTAEGRLVKGGGPTVKNVTGYDLPRLLVGSLGTIGVIVQVTLRLQPRPVRATWAVRPGPPADIRARLHAASALLWDGRGVHVLLEGHPADVVAQVAAAGLDEAPGAPGFPDGLHRGRVSVRPGALGALADALDAIPGCRWLAEAGVGTVHVAGDIPGVLVEARATAGALDGWLLREAGGEGLDGFGRPLPAVAVMRRVKAAFDPAGKLSPGRLPL